MIRLTPKGERYIPRVPHHFASWGAVRELLRVRGGQASRDEILGVLTFCGHPDPQFDPNTEYLGYALKQGWLRED
jgi:hypothetical protein